MKSKPLGGYSTLNKALKSFYHYTTHPAPKLGNRLNITDARETFVIKAN